MRPIRSSSRPKLSPAQLELLMSLTKGGRKVNNTTALSLEKRGYVNRTKAGYTRITQSGMELVK